jgi:CTP:phosphocholine cytidylyltransferase-like protein
MNEFIKLIKSDKPLKKYVFIYNEDGKIKKIHFGSKGSSTYLDHRDKTKRDNYLKRHKVNEDWTKINAGSLSAYILWGDSIDLNKNLNDYLKRFKFL